MKKEQKSQNVPFCPRKINSQKKTDYKQVNELLKELYRKPENPAPANENKE